MHLSGEKRAHDNPARTDLNDFQIQPVFFEDAGIFSYPDGRPIASN